MVFEFFGRWIFFRIGCIDAVYPCAFQDHFGLDLDGAKGAGGIGRKIRVARTGSKNHDTAFFHMPDGPAADIGFCDLFHFDSACKRV